MDALLERLAVHHAPPIVETRPSQPAPEHWFWIVDEIGPSRQRLILITDIQSAVAKHYDLTPNDLISERRSQREVLPRHIAMYLCHALTTRSHEVIAKWFNRYDHSLSIYAFNKISRLLKSDEKLAESVAAIQKELAA